MNEACRVGAVGSGHDRLTAEARLSEALRSTLRLRQRTIFVTRDSRLSEMWADVSQLLTDLGADDGTILEYRHAVGHWCTVCERELGDEVSIGFVEQEPGVLDWFQGQLATLPSRHYGRRADAGPVLSTYTQRRTCRLVSSLFRMAGPPEPSHRVYRHALGVLDTVPRFSRPVEVHPQPPVALLGDELRQLLAFLGEANAGRIKRPARWPEVPPWRFWRAYVLTAVYEGLRPAELFRLKWAWIKEGIREDRRGPAGHSFRIEAPPEVNRKQHRWISRRLHPVAASELAAIRTEREYVFRWAPNLKYCERVAAEVLSQAVPAETWQRGKGLYILRKTHLTQIELARRGAAQESAGHSSGQITADSYLDPRQTDRDIDLLPDFLGRQTPEDPG